MAKGFTYFLTDQFGNVYNRYSVAHGEPRYTHATVVRFDSCDATPATKYAVNFASRIDLAEKAAASLRRPFYNARKDGLAHPIVDVYPVRAYPGRHKVEPKL